MPPSRIHDVEDVAAFQLCTGCGACKYIAPDEIDMVDWTRYGLRPEFKGDGPTGARADETLAVCPGIGLEHTYDQSDPDLIPELAAGWGPVLELWEGYATNDDARFRGSSGGAATALGMFCLEKGGMHGVLHITSRTDMPYLNETVLSTSREDLLERTGSRYAPASPCDSLDKIENAPAPCVFIGKPCDVAATQKARAIRPALDAKLGLTIGIFCAGTPSTQGTLEMLDALGVEDRQQVRSTRYRGLGWPGNARIELSTPDGDEVREMSYDDSWGKILQKHRQWRCYVCADHSGEFADIAVGDPWYREIPAGEPGRSLIVVRTVRGREILRQAIEAGYIDAEPVSPDKLPASQKHFESIRGHVWSRMLILRLFGAVAPSYKRITTFRFWWTQVSPTGKIKSLVGTIRRVFRRKLYRRIDVKRVEKFSAGD